MSREDAPRYPTLPGHRDAIDHPSALDDIDDPVVRANLRAGMGFAVWTPEMLNADDFVAMVAWRGGVFRVIDHEGRHSGTFASWAGAQTEARALVKAWESRILR